MSRKKCLRLTLCILLSLCIIGAAVYIFYWNNRPPATVPALTGGTEAVMTTRVQVISGVLEPDAYGDELYHPLGITLSEDSLLVADSMNDRIQIVGQTGTIRVGSPGSSDISYADSGTLADGYLENACFKKPSDIALQGNDIIVCDTGNNAIRRISDNVVLTIAGGTSAGYKDGKESEAMFNNPHSVAVAEDGTIYVSDTMNHCVRTIDADGNVTLFAGTPEQSGFTDGSSNSAQFYEPCGLSIGADGALYVADSANHAIRKIYDGTVTTVAGRPGSIEPATGYPAGGLVDGDESGARFNFPADIVVLSNGDIYVADTMNHCVRLISNGQIRTVLGNGEADKYYGSAENLKLSKPSGIASDGSTLFISDTLNNTVVAVPITEKMNKGRPLRAELLASTGISTTGKYAYNGEIRLYVDGSRVQFDRVKPWNTSERIYIPIRPLFESLGADFVLDNATKNVTITIDGQNTVLMLNDGYFILKGTAVMPSDEITRLFPYVLEWFPEFNVIAVSTWGCD